MLARCLTVVAVVFACCSGVAVASWTGASTSSSTFTAAAQFPPRLELVPDALGVAQAGTALHAAPGQYTPAAMSHDFSWLRCDSTGAACVAVGAGADYALGLADVGRTLRVAVTPRNGAASGVTARSDATPVVRALSLGPVLSGPPVQTVPQISGSATVGGTLTGTAGDWTLPPVNTLERQWLRCSAAGDACVAIPGATGPTYVPTASDRGLRVRERVTAAALGLLPNSATSVASARVT